MLNEFFRDLRFGGRLLRRSPAFTFTAIVSLALGIGGATAVFSLINAIVLRSLPVPDPQQLYVAEVHMPRRDFGNILSAPTFNRVRDALAERKVGELFAASSVAGMQLQLEGQGAPARGNGRGRLRRIKRTAERLRKSRAAPPVPSRRHP